ncbi:MAG: ankyrin repeat domain-containing protein [Bryobacteraceae bacterium]|nr:ankyrin repeat domain-containing protein [Bryobacteraceae bacterium]
MGLIERIEAGRTDLVFETEPGERDAELLRTCAYFGDVSAIRFLLSRGADIAELGENRDLNGAAFHCHWRLAEFLIERGADPNFPLPDTGETPLHAALCQTNSARRNPTLQVLLKAGANPNVSTIPGVETGSFMRDCRTKGEFPLHRAAAFGDEEAVRMLLAAGARVDARDAFGDTPLGWASWYERPVSLLRLLLYGEFRIHPKNRPMESNLIGDPAE